MYFIWNFIYIYFVFNILGIFCLTAKQIMPSIFLFKSGIFFLIPNPLKTLGFLFQARWPQSCCSIDKFNQRGKSDVSNRKN
tara:strand:- start:903 stop:1145 length:243 start_codon:yes stop_codon:yes gene_type:complete